MRMKKELLDCRVLHLPSLFSLMRGKGFEPLNSCEMGP